MKKIFIILAGIALLASCKTLTKTHIVTVNIDESKITSSVKPESYSVTIKNVVTQQEKNVTSTKATAVIEGVYAGVYNVSIAGSATEDGITKNYSGTVANVSVLADATVTVAAEVVEPALVFKEIYYTGCKYTAPGAEKESNYFKDQFYEIYNNSDNTIYVDGLCIGTVYNRTVNTSGYTYSLPEGEDVKDYVFTQYVWKVPGDGTQYPLQPGESFVMAQQALNHTLDGNTYGKSLDLSKVEFEFISEEIIANGRCTDNPDVPNMLVGHKCGTNKTLQWLTSATGEYYVIWFPEKKIAPENEITFDNGISTFPVYPIKKSDIIDAVEAGKDEASSKNKLYFSPLDDGYLFCPEGNYSFQSIARKGETKNGRLVLVDTNNSNNDFEYKTDPQLRRGGVGAPNWK
ncbi:MAG: DUF4876 domain-containing protein [Bacteroidales bacterium]|nr:DUF4876 domain-containing protein [Bacteroidales bacterium]